MSKHAAAQERWRQKQLSGSGAEAFRASRATVQFAWRAKRKAQEEGRPAGLVDTEALGYVWARYYRAVTEDIEQLYRTGAVTGPSTLWALTLAVRSVTPSRKVRTDAGFTLTEVTTTRVVKAAVKWLGFTPAEGLPVLWHPPASLGPDGPEGYWYQSTSAATYGGDLEPVVSPAEEPPSEPYRRVWSGTCLHCLQTIGPVNTVKEWLRLCREPCPHCGQKDW